MAAFAQITQIERRVTGPLSAGHCPVFESIAKNPEGRIEEVYFKFVDDRGIVNELLAPEVALSLKIPAARTYACACSGFHLRNEDLPFETKSEQWYRGVASVAANAFRYRGPNAPALLEQELLNWKGLPYAAAFDELIINDDRNFQNILKVAPEKFILIDHEQAFGGAAGSINDDVFSRATSGNYLAGLIFRSGHEFTIKRMYNAAVEFGRVIQSAKIGDFDAIDRASKCPVGTTEHLWMLLRARAKALEGYLHHHQAANDLFALSSA